jgi:DNA polymerase V
VLHAGSKIPKYVALVDCNNFYASCERVFKPAWNSRPIGVLSNNDGCIVARSNELKAAGIPMGAPYFKYRRQLEMIGAVVVSSNYELYGDMSSRVMNTLESLAPGIEVYSIDEAWLKLPGIQTEMLDEHGRNIVSKTHQHTGIPVSMGIGLTKVLAKVANRICKQQKTPGSVFKLIDHETIERCLADIPVEEVWGVGHRWAERLNRNGIYSALDLRNTDPFRMRKVYGVVMQRLIFELQGQSCLEFEDIEPKKLIISSRSFGSRVTELSDLLEATSFHATRAGEKLRKQHSACGALQVFVKTGKHNPREGYFNASAIVKFPVQTSDTRSLIKAAQQGIKRIFKPGHRYAKTGVMLLEIGPANAVQSDFFGTVDSHQSQTLMQLVDRINVARGKHTLFFGSEGTRKSWAMKRERKTCAYTTRWSELPTVS